MKEVKEGQRQNLLEALKDLKDKTRAVRALGEDVASATKDKSSRHVDQIAALLSMAEQNLIAAMERMQVINLKQPGTEIKSRESNRFPAQRGTTLGLPVSGSAQTPSAASTTNGPGGA
jgi:hypothetical protein